MPKSRVFIVSVLVVVALTDYPERPSRPRPTTPSSSAAWAVDEALAARGLKAAVDIKVAGQATPRSFAISFVNGGARIVAPDANGALYGALELAERIRRHGADASGGEPSVSGRPFLRDRGRNFFLTLPWDYAKKRTRTTTRAPSLTPARWWFANDGFWRTLPRPDGPGPDELARHPWRPGTSASPTRPISTPTSFRASGSRKSASRPTSRPG